MTGNEKIVVMLLDHGAQRNIANEFGLTPLMAAKGIKNQSIAKLLLQRGATPGKKEILSAETKKLQAHMESGYDKLIKVLHDTHVGTTNT